MLDPDIQMVCKYIALFHQSNGPDFTRPISPRGRGHFTQSNPMQSAASGCDRGLVTEALLPPQVWHLGDWPRQVPPVHPVTSSRFGLDPVDGLPPGLD
jgi:hypothetical protein